MTRLNSILTSTKWRQHLFSTEVRKMLAYRADFWIQFLVSVAAQIAVAGFLWSAIYKQNNTDTMMGFTFPTIMFYYVLIPVVYRILYGKSVGFAAQEIYDGTLNRYIIYPVHFVEFKFIQFVASGFIYYLQLIIAVSLFFLILPNDNSVPFSFFDFLMGSIALIFAATLAFFINLTLEFFAFWADNVWSLLIMLRFITGLLGGQMIPLAFFPEKVVPLLNLLPFQILTSFPVLTFLGKMTPSLFFQNIFLALGWSALFALTANLLWQKGKYKYNGVGI